MGITNHFEQNDAIKDIMANMEACNWVTMTEENLKSTTWAVNPELHIHFKTWRDKIVAAKKAIIESIKESVEIRRQEKAAAKAAEAEEESKKAAV